MNLLKIRRDDFGIIFKHIIYLVDFSFIENLNIATF